MFVLQIITSTDGSMLILKYISTVPEIFLMDLVGKNYATTCFYGFIQNQINTLRMWYMYVRSIFMYLPSPVKLKPKNVIAKYYRYRQRAELYDQKGTKLA